MTEKKKEYGKGRFVRENLQMNTFIGLNIVNENKKSCLVIKKRKQKENGGKINKEKVKLKLK